jgi:DNA-binding IclR family transcriptional regulator
LEVKTFDHFLKTTKLTPLTAKTITSKTALRQQIETGRQRKWFLNREESLEGVLTLSSSFVWNSATFIVTIAGPSARLEPRLEAAAVALVELTGRLEMRTGADF